MSSLCRVAFFSCAVLGFAGNVAAYSCGTPSANHCYGTNVWSQSTEYFGAYADISQATLSCSSGCGGFVDDEIWLVDYDSPQCNTNDFSMCWVEAGTNATDGNNRSYFWAEGRAGSGNTFNAHYFGTPDPVGTVDHYMLIKDGRSNPNPYLIFIYNDSQSTLYSGTSTVAGTGGCGGSDPAQMVGKTIIIGQELAGSSGASAGTANFTRNIWAVQALDAGYTFWYNAETAAGSVTSAAPPTASWTAAPGSPGAPEGGQFTTRCCD
jgi:hypothetical protein